MSEVIDRDLFDQQGNSILIIEKDEKLSQKIKNFLTCVGFEVSTAINGKVALDMLKHITKPSLILLDPVTNVMNGWEFEKHLNRDAYYSTIPIVLLLSQAIKVAGLKYKEIFLNPQNLPLNLEDLLSTVKRYFFRGVFSESEDFDFKYPIENKGFS